MINDKAMRGAMHTRFDEAFFSLSVASGRSIFEPFEEFPQNRRPMALLCPLREQLLRKDGQATAALLEGNGRIELAAELKGQEANAWERASEEVRAIDAKYAQARIAFLLHLRTHTWEPLK
jgi:hypothetical protein